MREGVDIIVDGHAVRLIDLSTEGAQVTSTLVLKPNQRVRVSLVDESGTQRLAGLIVWAAYELPRPGRPVPSTARNCSFSHGDAAAIDAFAQAPRAAVSVARRRWVRPAAPRANHRAAIESSG
jgi:hypothetical protein